MNICSKCGIECEWVKHTNRCRKCVSDKQNEWQRKKKNRLCVYCNQPYTPKGPNKECSPRCQIMNNIKDVEGCWEWQRTISKMGYGKTRYLGKDETTHRVSFMVFKGEIPEGMNVCHSCDNRKCCNPDHLWIGTTKDNVQDCIRKGRRKLGSTKGYRYLYRKKNMNKKGENHHINKLKDNDVLEIRIMIENGNKNKEIANRYDVDASVVSKIKNRKAWSHI